MLILCTRYLLYTVRTVPIGAIDRVLLRGGVRYVQPDVNIVRDLRGAFAKSGCGCWHPCAAGAAGNGRFLVLPVAGVRIFRISVGHL
jgi:hypothetical protein